MNDIQQFVSFLTKLSQLILMDGLKPNIYFNIETAGKEIGLHVLSIQFRIIINGICIYNETCTQNQVQEMINTFMAENMVVGIRQRYMHYLEGEEHDREEASQK